MNSMMDSTKTNDDAPAVPEAWYWAELQVAPQ